MGRHASTHYRLEPTPALPDSRGRGGAARAERGWAGHRPHRPARAPGRPLGRVAGLDGGAERGRARSDRAPADGPPRRPRVARSRRREALLRGLLERGSLPLFHYLINQVPLHVRDWGAYERANRRFAEVVAAHHRPGDLVWVHDYHLMLVPQLVRELVPGARIGFFLHIPFPGSEVFRTLPNRERLLEGMLGADLVGFHTAAYMRHFASSLLRILGIAVDVDRAQLGERTVRLGVFPMGIDAGRFARLGADPEVTREVSALRGSGDCAVLLAIDRLDYTKGIPRRLLAFDRLLRRHPSLREHVRLIQVAVPSRTHIEVYRSLSERELVALYRAADVMLVTPVRDGMNLVAKEFVAARTDEDGVLVLSEVAGAAAELAEALHVNPYDVDRTSEIYYHALTLPAEERRARMLGLRRRVTTYAVEHWVRSFLGALEAADC